MEKKISYLNRTYPYSFIDGYKERHHIKPKCIGGTNDLSNLVNLTAREHYICHLLLCKIFDKSEALHRAFIRMSNDRNKKFISSRHYEEMKSNFAELRSQKMKKHNHMSGRVWVNDGIINKSIKSSDLLEFLDLGFRKGRLVDKKVLKLIYVHLLLCHNVFGYGSYCIMKRYFLLCLN